MMHGQTKIKWSYTSASLTHLHCMHALLMCQPHHTKSLSRSTRSLPPKQTHDIFTKLTTILFAVVVNT